MLSGFQLSRGPGGAFSSFVPLYHREMLERATSDRPLLLIPEELQETHPCFQNQVFLEPPKQLEEVTETSTSCSASVEEAFEHSAPQSQRPKGCAEKPQSSGTAKPQVLRGSLWAAGLSRNYIVYESGSPCGIKCHA